MQHSLTAIGLVSAFGLRFPQMQLLIMLAIVPLCVAFGYAMAAVLDDGSIFYCKRRCQATAFSSSDLT